MRLRSTAAMYTMRTNVSTFISLFRKDPYTSVSVRLAPHYQIAANFASWTMRPIYEAADDNIKYLNGNNYIVSYKDRVDIS